jgi:hypothetical protein
MEAREREQFSAKQSPTTPGSSSFSSTMHASTTGATINIATAAKGAAEPEKPIAAPTPAAAVTATTQSPRPTSLEQMEKAVQALSLQIEALTALVAEQPTRRA